MAEARLGLNSSAVADVFALSLLHRHMIKYKYVPFDIGRKTRYGGQR